MAILQISEEVVFEVLCVRHCAGMTRVKGRQTVELTSGSKMISIVRNKNSLGALKKECR